MLGVGALLLRGGNVFGLFLSVQPRVRELQRTDGLELIQLGSGQTDVARTLSSESLFYIGHDFCGHRFKRIWAFCFGLQLSTATAPVVSEVRAE